MPEMKNTIQKVIPYIGGEWHGEGRENTRITSNPKKLENVGMPPRYLGNNNYDAYIEHIKHEPYHLIEHEGIFYYVAESWKDDFPANLDTPHETANARKMREEKESEVKSNRRTVMEGARSLLLSAVIEKHTYIDGLDGHIGEPEFYFNRERKCWEKYKKRFDDYNDYKGEPLMTKERFKI